jgi:hypothetical protein
LYFYQLKNGYFHARIVSDLIFWRCNMLRRKFIQMFLASGVLLSGLTATGIARASGSGGGDSSSSGSSSGGSSSSGGGDSSSSDESSSFSSGSSNDSDSSSGGSNSGRGGSSDPSGSSDSGRGGSSYSSSISGSSSHNTATQNKLVDDVDGLLDSDNYTSVSVDNLSSTLESFK